MENETFSAVSQISLVRSIMTESFVKVIDIGKIFNDVVYKIRDELKKKVAEMAAIKKNNLKNNTKILDEFVKDVVDVIDYQHWIRKYEKKLSKVVSQTSIEIWSLSEKIRARKEDTAALNALLKKTNDRFNEVEDKNKENPKTPEQKVKEKLIIEKFVLEKVDEAASEIGDYCPSFLQKISGHISDYQRCQPSEF